MRWSWQKANLQPGINGAVEECTEKYADTYYAHNTHVQLDTCVLIVSQIPAIILKQLKKRPRTNDILRYVRDFQFIR